MRGSSEFDSSPIPPTKHKHPDGHNKDETEPARKIRWVSDGSDSGSDSKSAEAEEADAGGGGLVGGQTRGCW